MIRLRKSERVEKTDPSYGGRRGVVLAETSSNCVDVLWDATSTSGSYTANTSVTRLLRCSGQRVLNQVVDTYCGAA